MRMRQTISSFKKDIVLQKFFFKFTALTINTLHMESINTQTLRSATISALYYLLVYIPIILPLNIWNQAAIAISGIWESKTLNYQGSDKYGLAKFLYEKMILAFIFDAMIFLAWPFLLYQALFELHALDLLGHAFDAGFVQGMKALIYGLLGIYTSVISIRLFKEAFFWAIDNLLSWIISVIRAIGGFCVNAWKLNLVIRRKD